MGRFRLSERIRQIRSQIDRFSKLDPAARADLLDTVCGEPAKLKETVDSMLEESSIVTPADLLSSIQSSTFPPAKIRKGQTIAQYTIIEKLGGGGMGIVYKAHDGRLDRPVALKFLPARMSTDDQAKARFINEAKAASALDHPNICTVHDIRESHEGQLYISMAYYKGKTLKKKMEEGPLTLGEAVRYAVEIAKGLERAHEAGITHRDIKPANVMITDRGEVKIVDFGLAKVQNVHITRTSATLGTVAYMSPEQAQGGDIDHRTDIWSLGVVLYEMVTGERPFRGEYEPAVLYEIMNSEPITLSEKRSDVPEGLIHTVDRMLRKKPEDRYRDIGELLTDLRRVQAGRTGDGSKVPGLSSSPISDGGNRRTGLIAAVCLVIIAVIAALLYYPTQKINFSERDWILITDFVNETGEEIFDHSLNTALAVSISQSQYANVFPRRRIRHALQRMKRDQTGPIDAELGSEIAQREGIPIVLVPSISRVGDRYALTSVIQDSESGEMLKSEIVPASGKNEVLEALDKMTTSIRRELGETVSSINRHRKPLAKVTTESLDALKQYALGIEEQRNGRFGEARKYFERALQIDSTFTSARASLGMLHMEMAGFQKIFDRDIGKELLADAVHHVDSLTDVEKYGILAFHAQMVEENLEQAADYHETLLGLHPDYGHVHNNLGRVYRFMGQFGRAEVEFKNAIRLDPSLTLAYNNLNLLYLFETGNVDSAYIWTRQLAADSPDYYYAHNLLGWTYLGMDSLRQAESAFRQSVELNPNFTWGLYRLGHTLRLQGRFGEAVEAIERVREVDPEDYHAFEQLGKLYRMQDSEKEAERYFDRFREATLQDMKTDPDNASLHYQLARAYAYLKEEDQARETLGKALEMDSTLYLDHARLLSVLNEEQRALNKLEQALEAGFRNYIWVKIHPDFQPHYDDPSFITLLNQYLKI